MVHSKYSHHHPHGTVGPNAPKTEAYALFTIVTFNEVSQPFAGYGNTVPQK